MTSFKQYLLLVLFLYLSLPAADALATRFRVMWRDDPASSMVIGWDQIGGNSPILFYGPKDMGRQTHNYPFSSRPQRSIQAKGMQNTFVRLQNLRPNTVYYFVIADGEGVSRSYSFRTAPAGPNPQLKIIAGGDSRNYQDARVRANRLVSRLRPTFVLFAGDMTVDDKAERWKQWLDDWQESIGQDGRIFPIVVARGNHEYSNESLLHLFDLPSPNNYYALAFGGDLLRVYTLNSMMASGGTQRDWLEDDLRREGARYTWRLVQYHHAMRPHTRLKRERNDLFSDWAGLFYRYGVQVAVESDAHVVKWTYPIRPAKNWGGHMGFIRDEERGTVYLGEGCWGAPLRENDDDKPWTRASGSFNQFKLLFVNQQRIEIRTIPTDQDGADQYVSDAAPFRLPSQLRIWSPPSGSVVVIPNRDQPQTPPPADTEVAIETEPPPRNETNEQQAASKPSKPSATDNEASWSQLPRVEYSTGNAQCSVPLRLPRAGDVTVKVFNLDNEEVFSVKLQGLPAGRQLKKLTMKEIGPGCHLLLVRMGDKNLHYYQLNRGK